ncbi:MAG: hypothetical protein COA47_17355 [Robiginitomaculum sp.]|nr:MAG: hypothetical protein COA47_17355 [Robiginitomaculum sp.]
MLWTILILVYAVIAGFALFMTFSEKAKSGSRGLRWAPISLFACLIWPITIVAVIVAARRQHRLVRPS